MKPAVRARPATNQIGARAENVALRFLDNHGLQLVTRNFRCRAGELDLVMLDGGTLVLVEVRYRARPDPVHPCVTVTATKRRRLLRAAQWFLASHARFRNHPVRFDVMALSGALDTPACEWFRGAFDADDV